MLNIVLLYHRRPILKISWRFIHALFHNVANSHDATPSMETMEQNRLVTHERV